MTFFLFVLTGKLKDNVFPLAVGVVIISVFLPLVSVSAFGESTTVSFFSAKSGKIILGLMVVALILLLIQIKKSNLALKIVSLLLIAVAGIIFLMNVDKLSNVKSILKTLYSYSVGYYLMMIGFVVSFGIGLVTLLIKKKEPSYSTDTIPVNNNYNMNQEPVNNLGSVNPVPSEPNNEYNHTNLGTSIRLSDLVNKNHKM